MNSMNKFLIPFSLAVLLAPLAGYSQGIGALFTTPEEREYLDYLREDFLARTAEAGFDIDQEAVPDIPETEEEVQENLEFHLNGIMTRVDGGRTVWLNGSPIFERDLPSNASIVMSDGIAALRLVTPDNAYILKPGQTVDISTGQFWESFERRPGSAESTDDAEELSPTEFANDTQQLVNDAAGQDLSPMDLIESLQFVQEVENE